MVTPSRIEAPSLGPAAGYSHGFRAGDLLFVAGQIGGDPIPGGRHRVVSPDFVPQFEKALRNVLEVVRAAGGRSDQVVEMTVYVKDMNAYRSHRKALGDAWRTLMGRHYPAMTLVEVSDLFEAGALVEMRAVAALG